LVEDKQHAMFSNQLETSIVTHPDVRQQADEGKHINAKAKSVSEK